MWQIIRANTFISMCEAIHAKFVCTWQTHLFEVLHKYTWLKGEIKVIAYPGDGLQDGQEGQWAGPPVGQRGPEAEAGLAVEGLT